MHIENFIQKYTIQNIKELEHSDPQFLALKKSRKNITNNKKPNKNLFLFLVLQCALVSYQISGSGEVWREEVGQKISQNRNILQNLRNKKQSNNQRRYNFLTTSRYNKRIYNIKTNRLKKFDKILTTTKDFGQYQNNKTELQKLIAQVMNTNNQSKTIVFAIKMFGYADQIINKNRLKYPIYPQDISIPVDSRIKKIYKQQFPHKNNTDFKIQKYFNQLSLKYNIAPLHLDSILWLDYWTNFTKNNKI